MSPLTVSEEVGLVDTTTSIHIHRAFSSTTFNPSTGAYGLASSSTRPSQEISNQAISGIDIDHTRANPTGFSQPQQDLNCSSLALDADYTLDTSDWLLENEVFELFDFRSLRSGSSDSQRGRENHDFPHARDLRDVWYVPVAKDDDDPGTSAAATSRPAIDLRDDIDEAYRADMATTLLLPVRNEPLPSIDLLVSQVPTIQSNPIVSQICRMSASVSFSHV